MLSISSSHRLESLILGGVKWGGPGGRRQPVSFEKDVWLRGEGERGRLRVAWWGESEVVSRFVRDLQLLEELVADL